LLILDETGADATMAQLREQVSVTHMFGPRVVVVSDERDPAPTLASIPGVRRVYADDVAAEQLESDEAFTELDREETLAIRAWLYRQQPEKHRPGEGLAWDAEGYEPP